MNVCRNTTHYYVRLLPIILTAHLLGEHTQCMRGQNQRHVEVKGLEFWDCVSVSLTVGSLRMENPQKLCHQRNLIITPIIQCNVRSLDSEEVEVTLSAVIVQGFWSWLSSRRTINKENHCKAVGVTLQCVWYCYRLISTTTNKSGTNVCWHHSIT